MGRTRQQPSPQAATPGTTPIATGYAVNRVVICDAYKEPDQHYRLLEGGKTQLTQGRRPSMSILDTASRTRSGLAGIAGRQASFFEDMSTAWEKGNDQVNALRAEVKAWREGKDEWAGRPYGGTREVTRHLLEWWFERDEERTKQGKRFFFGQQEAIETLIYLYEVKSRQKMPNPEPYIRYALKLATGTGKTVVMAMLIVWSTLHRQKVNGSPLSTNFLVLVPNLTVRDRVSGKPRGDGLMPGGDLNLYSTFDMVPPEYQNDFYPNVKVINWQAVPLEGQRQDWPVDDVTGEGQLVSLSTLYFRQRRKQQSVSAQMRHYLDGWRDVLVINDEAHHVYGEKRKKKGEDPEYIKWSKIIGRVSQAMRLSMVVDLSATPWYGTGSAKPDGTLFEWVVSDFSVYDAFESGLVKVVRLPEAGTAGAQYLDLWDMVKGAKTKEEYLIACKGAIDSIYSDWKKEYEEWAGLLDFARKGPAPVLLIVADNATHAGWLYEHVIKAYEGLKNDSNDTKDAKDRVTIRIDSKIFEAEGEQEEQLREMVNTVGVKGKPGENVRCIISVNMLSEGWDVKSVTHILGLRAFSSPLLTEQVIGRGLRRVSYDILNQPLSERPAGTDETVDAFGIPFIGFPVEKGKRSRAGQWDQKPIWIAKDDAKRKYQISVPNVRTWAVGATESFPAAVRARMPQLAGIVIDPEVTPPEVRVRPVVGDGDEAVMTLEQFRREYPLLYSKMIFARELFEATNPQGEDEILTGPTYEELLEFASNYVDTKVRAIGDSEVRDIGMNYWSSQALAILETTIRDVQVGTRSLPILANPDYLDTDDARRFQWTGIIAAGKKCHLNNVACHNDLERRFAEFLDEAGDVLRYVKNERFGFSVTYFENNRPRQYFPDFIVVTRNSSGQEVSWLAETKGEIYTNTDLKSTAARLWCERMSTTRFGKWQYLFVPQADFINAISRRADTFASLVEALATKRGAKL